MGDGQNTDQVEELDTTIRLFGLEFPAEDLLSREVVNACIDTSNNEITKQRIRDIFNIFLHRLTPEIQAYNPDRTMFDYITAFCHSEQSVDDFVRDYIFHDEDGYHHITRIHYESGLHIAEVQRRAIEAFIPGKTFFTEYDYQTIHEEHEHGLNYHREKHVSQRNVKRPKTWFNEITLSADDSRDDNGDLQVSIRGGLVDQYTQFANRATYSVDTVGESAYLFVRFTAYGNVRVYPFALYTDHDDPSIQYMYSVIPGEEYEPKHDEPNVPERLQYR